MKKKISAIKEKIMYTRMDYPNQDVYKVWIDEHHAEQVRKVKGVEAFRPLYESANAFHLYIDPRALTDAVLLAIEDIANGKE